MYLGGVCQGGNGSERRARPGWQKARRGPYTGCSGARLTGAGDPGGKDPGGHPRAAHGTAREGYSLYSREVSSTPDDTPVPSGTSTPSRVMLAEGSGVVLPKPAEQKARVRPLSRRREGQLCVHFKDKRILHLLQTGPCGLDRAPGTSLSAQGSLTRRCPRHRQPHSEHIPKRFLPRAAGSHRLRNPTPASRGPGSWSGAG